MTALVGLILATPAAARTARLRTGSTPYVRLVHLRDGRLSLALTARGRRTFRRALRGYVLDVTCTTLGSSAQGFSQSSESSGAEGGLGPHGRVTYHVLLDRHADFCDVGRARQRTSRNGVSTGSAPGPALDRLALSQKGAAFIDEDRVTARAFAVIGAAIESTHKDRAGSFPPAQKIAAMFAGSPDKVVALASPDGSPPAGVVGFYSDGASHAEAVALSAVGRRLFIDSSVGVLSTNAAEHLVRVTSGDALTLSGD